MGICSRLRLDLEFDFWMSRIPEASSARVLCIQCCCCFNLPVAAHGDGEDEGSAFVDDFCCGLECSSIRSGSGLQP